MITRTVWWFRLHATWTAVSFLLVALACFFGPEDWFSAHSVSSFHDLTHIPWPVVGVAFAVVPAFLTYRRLRLAAYCVAFVLSGFSVFTLLLFSATDRVVINAPIYGLSLLIPLAMLNGIRYCVLTNQRIFIEHA